MEKQEVCCTPTAANPGRNSGCMRCGAPLVYGAEQERECAICHGKFVSGSVCENGHYVCDSCHTMASDAVLTFLRFSPERDPVRLMAQVMTLPAVHLFGPEHHRLVPAVLLTAYHNCGGAIDLPAALNKAFQRGKQVPGGTCGYWGVCGAAAGAGIYASIVTDSSPTSRKAWALPQKLTAKLIGRIAEYGGVRCCKRTSFLSIQEAVAWTKEVLGVELPMSCPVCQWSAQNRDCLGSRCPFHKTTQKE